MGLESEENHESLSATIYHLYFLDDVRGDLDAASSMVSRQCVLEMKQKISKAECMAWRPICNR